MTLKRYYIYKKRFDMSYSTIDRIDRYLSSLGYDVNKYNRSTTYVIHNESKVHKVKFKNFYENIVIVFEFIDTIHPKSY